MKRITVQMLRESGACAEQVRTFERRFPRGAPVSSRSAKAACAAGIDIWYAERYLKAPAWAEYQRVTAAVLAEYQRVTAAAWAEYERVKAPAWAEYQRVKAAALIAGLLAS